jgi:hypothetical protein
MIPRMTRRLTIAICVLFAAWHAFDVLGKSWPRARRSASARDFASYYYAAAVAEHGGDPYNTKQLEHYAFVGREQVGRLRRVFPYLYPPAFLLAVSWAPVFSVHTAYQLWFWVNELALCAVVVVLLRWWRRLGDGVSIAVFAALALMTPIELNHMAGQANLLVMALVMASLWQVDEGREKLGGALMGVAVILKMSPGLIVAWWIFRRKWTAVSAACAAAVLCLILSAIVFGMDVQRTFWLDVFPSFGSGDYNGLTVPVGTPGNHSIAHLWNRVVTRQGHLTGFERGLWMTSVVALLGGLAWVLRRPQGQGLSRAAEASAVLLAMLIVPAYAFEHHLVWAIPALVVSALAVERGQLVSWWVGGVTFAWAAICLDRGNVRRLLDLCKDFPLLYEPLQQLKFVALLVLLAAMLRVARSPSEERPPLA